jgi:hypothetical protein
MYSTGTPTCLHTFAVSRKVSIFQQHFFHPDYGTWMIFLFSADPHHFNVNRDPDSAFHFNSDPD